MPKRFDTLIYHNECPDGYNAAFVLYLAHMVNSSTKIIPDVPNATSAPQVSGHVVVTDVAYKTDVLKGVIEQAESVLFIDHHISHIDELRELEKNEPKLTVIYDVNECGSTLTWKHFFPDTPPPFYLRMIRDNDIGIWNMPDTHAFVTAFETEFVLEPTIEGLKKLKPLLQKDELKKLITRGQYYYRYRDYMIKRATKYGTKLHWGKYYVGFINIAGAIASEAATRIAKEDKNLDFVVAYHYNISKRAFIYQLRSTKTNVEAIARRRGGGGHELAASFQEKLSPDQLVKEQAGGMRGSAGLEVTATTERAPCRDEHTDAMYAIFETQLSPTKLVREDP